MFFADKETDIPSYHVPRLSSHASCNVETNERGLRLLEFATFNNLVLINNVGSHKPPRRRTWHSLDTCRKHHNQIVYILVRKHFGSGVNIHSFPGAGIGTDHDLVMMTFEFI